MNESLQEGKYIQSAMSIDHSTCPSREGIIRAKVGLCQVYMDTETHTQMQLAWCFFTNDNCSDIFSFIQEPDGFWNHIVETQHELLSP